MQKLIYGLMVALLLISEASFGVYFADDFSTDHDFLANGVTGTGWNGFIYNAGHSSTQNAVVTTAGVSSGVLNLATSNGNWENADDDGAFLYVDVPAGADFTTTVYISAYTWVSYHDVGIMARVGMGTTENYVMSRYFARYGVDNSLRSVDENVTTNNNGTSDPAMPYLQLEKSGSLFIVRASTDGVTYIDIASIERSDMANVALQVGLYQATFSGNIGTVAFDNFSLELSPIAASPSPKDGEEMVATTTDLSWSAPLGYSPIGYDIYIGTDPNVANVSRQGWTSTTINPVIDLGYSLDKNTVYYWRVDTLEPNDLAPIVHAGQVWSFTTVPLNPVITVDPVSQTVPVGTVIDLSATASNADAYTWYQSVDAIADEGDTMVGTGQIIQLAIDSIAREGWYYCVASNPIGGDTSAMARVMTRRLVGYWDFDGNLTDKVTDGVPSHDGSATDPNYVAGVPEIGGQGYQFLGDGRVVTISDSADYFNFYPEGMTISCWVKSQSNNWGAFCSKEYEREISYMVGKGFFFTKNNGGGAQFGIRPSEVASSAGIADGDWHLVTAVYDPDTLVMRVYVDGVLSNKKESINPVAFNSPNLAPLIFGAESTDGTVDSFNGAIDEVKVWNYAQTSYSIAQQYVDVMGGYICVDGVRPTADLSGDCQVNLQDLSVLAENWLETNRVE